MAHWDDVLGHDGDARKRTPATALVGAAINRCHAVTRQDTGQDWTGQDRTDQRCIKKTNSARQDRAASVVVSARTNSQFQPTLRPGQALLNFSSGDEHTELSREPHTELV